jgi:hypothetical protein
MKVKEVTWSGEADRRQSVSDRRRAGNAGRIGAGSRSRQLGLGRPRQDDVMTIIAERGENLRAISDVIEECLHRKRYIQAQIAVDLLNAELRHGAAQLGYRFLQP